tara:strand:- start:772 stop:1368 length:597 start_codon:yes stop_codon:yes gene_type:complete
MNQDQNEDQKEDSTTMNMEINEDEWYEDDEWYDDEYNNNKYLVSSYKGTTKASAFARTLQISTAIFSSMLMKLSCNEWDKLCQALPYNSKFIHYNTRCNKSEAVLFSIGDTECGGPLDMLLGSNPITEPVITRQMVTLQRTWSVEAGEDWSIDNKDKVFIHLPLLSQSSSSESDSGYITNIWDGYSINKPSMGFKIEI